MFCKSLAARLTTRESAQASDYRCPEVVHSVLNYRARRTSAIGRRADTSRNGLADVGRYNRERNLVQPERGAGVFAP